MIIEGYCRVCGNQFDCHWSKYPELTSVGAIMNPYCPHCKSVEISTWSDESKDYEYDEPIESEWEDDD
jgi:hypothetical protein